MLPAQEDKMFNESMPVYGDCSKSDNLTQCSNSNIIKYISLNLEYPEAAKSEFIEGTVVLGLTIDENGKIINPEIIRDIGGGCGAEGMRLLEMMPKWKPAEKNGTPVPVRLTLPIRFALGDEQPRSDNTHRILWGTLSNREVVTPEMLKANLLSAIFVLDEKGNKVPTNELTFSINKRNKYWDASSTGEITAEMIKLVGKVKPGVIFAIVGTIQVKGGFEFVEKEFEVVKEL